MRERSGRKREEWREEREKVRDGWDRERERQASRREQLKRLRQLCIPEIASLLHTVLNSTKNYKECVKLADLIASENHRLYQVRTQLQLSVNTMYSYCQLYIIHAAYCTSENISW